MDEGYIKFNCNWIRGRPIEKGKLVEINKWRQNLYRLGLIGKYPNGVGFGNISIREGSGFFITGSKTGGLSLLDENHYTKVVDFDLETNSLTCMGPIIASSESITHAVFYQVDPNINAVIHVHNNNLWKRLLGKVPTSAHDIPYGTPEIAREVLRLYKTKPFKKKRILVMAGHEDGIISFGENLEEAGKTLLDYL